MLFRERIEIGFYDFAIMRKGGYFQMVSIFDPAVMIIAYLCLCDLKDTAVCAGGILKRLFTGCEVT